MRKENSEILTHFISESGTYKLNRDFFAFVELDDLCCWVLADGIDSNEKNMSAEMAVSSILDDFTQKPDMSRRCIKKYIKNANKYLKQESDLQGYKASILVVISNYSSILWGSVGNTRLYHFRKNLELLKTKDHSIAQMLLDINKIDEKKLNFHPERNNLVSYLGTHKNLKINFGKRNYNIYDNDTLLMCTSGFWENISNPKINEKLKESSDGIEYLNKLQDAIIDSKNPNLNNYTMVSIFVKKAFKENIKKPIFSWKKVLVAILAIFTLLMGFTVYKEISKVKNKNKMQIENLKLIEKTIFDNKRNEKKAEELVLEGNYEEALKKYDELLERYEVINIKDKVEEMNFKIQNLKTIITSKNIEKKGDEFFREKKYPESLENYMNAKSEFLKIKGYNIEDLDAKIVTTHIELNTKEQMELLQIKAFKYEEEAAEMLKISKFAIAKEKMEVAKKIYTKMQMEQNSKEAQHKINEIDEIIKKGIKLNEASQLETEGDELATKREYEVAKLRYNRAKTMFFEVDMNVRAENVDIKIKDLDILKEYHKAVDFEILADSYYSNKNYKKALESYHAAKTMYEKLYKIREVIAVEEKIKKTKNKTKFLGVF